MMLLNWQNQLVSALRLYEMMFLIVICFLQGDKPRFFHQNPKNIPSSKSSESPKKSHNYNTSEQQIKNDNELKQQITSTSIKNQNIQDIIMKTEQDSNNEEDMILQSMKPQIMNLIKKQMQNEIFNGNRIVFQFETRI